MTTAADLSGSSVAWWKEPTKDQWLAWVAAWLGWTLDAFDFTMFLLIMVPISQEFHVPLTDVAFVLSVTLWLRLVGAVGSGWLADRVGRKIPLMISILWYSLSNFVGGLLADFHLSVPVPRTARHWHGRRMAGRWRTRDGDVAGTFARLYGRRPARLMGPWLYAVERGLWLVLYASIGWRGLLWIGVLPALRFSLVRKFVKEPPIWLENRRRQRAEQREVHAPLIAIFKKQMLANTLTACVWLGGGFIAYYSVNALFATHLQKDLHLTPGRSRRRSSSPILGTFLRRADGAGGPTALADAGRLSFRH